MKAIIIFANVLVHWVCWNLECICDIFGFFRMQFFIFILILFLSVFIRYLHSSLLVLFVLIFNWISLILISFNNDSYFFRNPFCVDFWLHDSSFNRGLLIELFNKKSKFSSQAWRLYNNFRVNKWILINFIFIKWLGILYLKILYNFLYFFMFRALIEDYHYNYFSVNFPIFLQSFVFKFLNFCPYFLKSSKSV